MLWAFDSDVCCNRKIKRFVVTHVYHSFTQGLCPGANLTDLLGVARSRDSVAQAERLAAFAHSVSKVAAHNQKTQRIWGSKVGSLLKRTVSKAKLRLQSDLGLSHNFPCMAKCACSV